jgi:hypothetical protein
VDTVALLPTRLDAAAEAHVRALPHMAEALLRPRGTSLAVLTVCSTKGSRAYRIALVHALALLFKSERHLHVISFQPKGMHCLPLAGSPLLRDLEPLAQLHNGSLHRFSAPAHSWAEVVHLFAQPDLVVTGSFHGALFARLAGTPALFTQGNTLKAAELAREIRSPAYTFVTNSDLLRAPPAALAGELLRLSRFDRTALRADGSMEKLRRMALANVAPHGLADCMDTEALFPTTVTLGVMREHAAFLRGGKEGVNASDTSTHFAWMGWGCGGER